MIELGVNSVFAGYRIEGMAGRGGMGIVYRATELRLDRPVALKVIAPQYAEDQAFRDRFERESRLAASIDHPNVIPVYKASEHEGRLFIAMRWVDGTDLAELIRDGDRLSPGRAVRLVAQIAQALDAAHARNLVHRDVKPANVMVAARDHAYLTDFGLTKLRGVTGLTATGGFVGTLDYTAPEQVSGDDVDGRADVYALGCLAYELFTGEVPFPRDSDTAKLFAHLSADPPRPTDRVAELPVAIDDVVHRALAKDRDERFASAGEFADALGAAARGDRSVTVDSPRARRVPARRPRPGRRVATSGLRRILLIAVPLVVAVPIAVAVFGAGDSGGGDFETIAIGGEPGELAVGLGRVWVADAASGAVRSLDLESTDAPPTATRVGRQPEDVVVGDGVLWVANFDEGTVSKVDPVSASAVGRPIRVGREPFALAVDDTRVWVLNQGDDTVVDIATASGKVGEPIRVGPRLTDVAVGYGAVWVVSEAGTLAKIDPESRRVADRTRLPVGGESVTTGERRVWVSSFNGDAVTRVAPASGKVVGDPIPVGKGPDGLVVADGSVWVTNFRSDTVTRIDARSGQPTGTPIEVGRSPGGIAYGDGALWVANYDGGTLTRIGLSP